MIISSYTYSINFKERIEEKLKSDTFCGDSWSDNDISDIRDSIKQFYIHEQEFTCPYCMQITRSNNGRMWDIEHIIPRENEKNFMFSAENLCVACPDCNNRKGATRVSTSKATKILPTRSDLYLIIHPHFDEYSQHIEVIKPGAFYVAKTKKGEKTIGICGLNRFYEYAGYSQGVTSDNLILQLANALTNAQTEQEKRQIRRDLAFAALKSNVI
ncbi:HNH endonuclease [Citrobacter koseri]|uniref:HNH endonuclease n=1 Tax=Citrobacter koseri TaxID=545 RepID=UPI001022978D|nr:HNH endonuclease signature motif containing protein [Citrobacter koseri]RZA60314.1 HNH endonuclease [Citrobacter koseri]HEM7950361.1 HNH endonuclease [Citrobacter koseri]